MKEQVNIKVLRDYLVHLDLSLMNIKDHQLHNKDIYFENERYIIIGILKLSNLSFMPP